MFVRYQTLSHAFIPSKVLYMCMYIETILLYISLAELCYIYM